ncbi:WAT1-related protein At5g64700 isoform X3 [Sorghum bicolor]|uniref:WAT1-related protein At5g64700 isoform X3 n=1 Tax=Sorghum bicolor TaxID=4558 RepID=UPI000B4251A3|nr:WAT1-related protein At5g64700 isoform X3 [Sorghum bicolor]|eukprot:XP_021312382.1 WAT1-related protein At5g64700 isoform X3 [Sorghum bicolor]
MEASMKPYCLAIMVQLIYTGLFVISKAAFNQGINTYIFFFYRQALGSVLLLPIALLQRMEDVKPRSSSGIAKVTGIALCLAGVFTIAFFTGPSISPVNHHHAFASDPAPAGSKQVVPKAVWIKWTFLMVVANMCWSLWIVFQPALLKDCPDKMVVTVTQCLFSTVQSFIVAVVAERDFSKWKLRFDISLLAILYSGFMVTGVSYYLQTWCIEMRGPMFFAAWTPLCFVFTIFCSSFFLGEIVHLGSILGGILLVGSLYTMLWGKSKEVKTDNITHDTEKAEHKNSAESYPEEQHRHTTPEL